MDQSIRVRVGSSDEEEQIVLVDGKLANHMGHIPSRSNNPERQRNWACVMDHSLTEHKAQPRRVLA
jgi:hypothetical protein